MLRGAGGAGPAHIVYERPVVSETVVAEPVVYDRPGVSVTVVTDRPVAYEKPVVSETVVAERPVVYDWPVTEWQVPVPIPHENCLLDNFLVHEIVPDIVCPAPRVMPQIQPFETVVPEPLFDDPDIRDLCCRNCGRYFTCKCKDRGERAHVIAPGRMTVFLCRASVTQVAAIFLFDKPDITQIVRDCIAIC